MNDGLFLVPRVAADSLGETLEWLGSDEPPFQPMDPLDFLSSAEVVAVYDLYRTQYLRLDARLNIRTPEALLEYNRWVIVVDRSGSVLGVFGEVSEGVERVVTGRVSEVPPAVAETVLGKAVVPHKDGRHSTREIANVGPKTKLLVGKPVLE